MLESLPCQIRLGTFGDNGSVLGPKHNSDGTGCIHAVRQCGLDRTAACKRDLGNAVHHLDNRAGEEVGFADEIRHKPVDRLVINFAWRTDLLDLARRHDGNAVRHGQRFFLIVRDENEGDAGFGLKALQLDLHFLAQFVIECRERLVKQQDFRLRGKRSGKCDTLLLAAGNLAGLAIGHRLHLDELEHGSATRASISAFGLPSMRRPKPMFSATVMCGNSA